MQQLPNTVLSAVFSNLAKAAEKQQLTVDSQYFNKLSAEFWSTETRDGNLTDYKSLVETDLESGYPGITKEASDDAAKDPGAQRCVKWGEKVTSIQKSLLNRFESKGDELFNGKNLYICEACGFIALGSDLPELCPVCKAPSSRFSKVK